MVTVSVTLSDEAYERLQRLAAETNSSVEQLLGALAEGQAGDEVTPEFRDLIARQTDRYEKLFSRLAQ